jgi:C-terminal processing protease CtpA/Prc
MDTRAAVAASLPPETGLVRRPSPPEVVRQDHVVEPDKTETRLEHVPVYYLTSSKTASAAEHLALAFRHTHRAVQIGETTRGAGHFGGGEGIGERFGAFMPLGRTYDPDTGWDWEGKGVAPDIAVPADQALDEALKQAKAKGVDVGS